MKLKMQVGLRKKGKVEKREKRRQELQHKNAQRKVLREKRRIL